MPAAVGPWCERPSQEWILASFCKCFHNLHGAPPQRLSGAEVDRTWILQASLCKAAGTLHTVCRKSKCDISNTIYYAHQYCLQNFFHLLWPSQMFFHILIYFLVWTDQRGCPAEELSWVCIRLLWERPALLWYPFHLPCLHTWNGSSVSRWQQEALSLSPCWKVHFKFSLVIESWL